MILIRQIIEATARASGLSRGVLTGPRRDRDIVVWRQAGMVLASRIGHTRSAIGRAYSRDHTTVIHACLDLSPRQTFKVEEAIRAIQREIEGVADDAAALLERLKLLTAAQRLEILRAMPPPDVEQTAEENEALKIKHRISRHRRKGGWKIDPHVAHFYDFGV